MRTSSKWKKRKAHMSSLQRQADAQAAKVAQLQAEHERLAREEAVLLAVCEALDWLRGFIAARQHQTATGDAAGSGPLPMGARMLPAAEELLLQHLGSMQVPTAASLSSAGSHGSSTVSGSGSDTGTAAHANAASTGDASSTPRPLEPQPCMPDDDLLLLLKQLMMQPPVEGAETLTVADLHRSYAATTGELALALHHHDAGPVSGLSSHVTRPPVERIQQMLLKHLHLLSTLMLCVPHGAHLVGAFASTNAATGELEQQATERYAWAAQHVQLAPSQQQQIADGLAVFQRLLAPVHAELRQLQQQLGSSLSGPSTACAPSTAAALEQLQQADQQQQALTRIQQLHAKRSILATMHCAHLVGRLSWITLARIAVLMALVPFSVMPMASAIVKRWRQAQAVEEEEEQQQQKQQ